MKELKVNARVARVLPSGNAAHAQLGIELTGDVVGFVEIPIDALDTAAWTRRIGNELGECAATLGVLEYFGEEHDRKDGTP